MTLRYGKLAVLAVTLAGLGLGQLAARQGTPAVDNKQDKKQLLMDYARKHPGDAEAGRKLLFANNLGCLSCHGQPGKGGDVGPDLHCIGRKYDREMLMRKILSPRPASAMPQDFADHFGRPAEFADLLAYFESACPKQ